MATRRLHSGTAIDDVYMFLGAVSNGVEDGGVLKFYILSLLYRCVFMDLGHFRGNVCGWAESIG